MIIRNGLLILTLLSQITLAQQASEQSSEDDVFLGELSLDDDLFADAFALKEDTNVDSWRDGLTIRLSQQLSGQVNNHTVEPIEGYLLSKPSELENNRFGVNVRFQNAFADGWLVQGSWQARAYWRGDY